MIFSIPFKGNTTPPTQGPLELTTNPPLIIDPIETPPHVKAQFVFWKSLFGLSTFLLLAVAVITSVSMVKVDRHHHTLTYTANAVDLANAYAGLIYQLLTSIVEFGGKESSFTSLKIIIRALGFLLLSGVGSGLFSSIVYAHDHSYKQEHPLDAHALAEDTLELLLGCLVINWVVNLFHLICLVHLIIVFRKFKQISPNANYGISVNSLEHQITSNFEMQTHNNNDIPAAGTGLVV